MRIQLGLTLLLFLLLSPLLLQQHSIPFTRSYRWVEVVKIYIPEQGYFDELCRQRWKDHCVEVYKDLPIWPDQWEGEDASFSKLKLETYLEEKDIQNYLLKKEELDLR